MNEPERKLDEENIRRDRPARHPFFVFITVIASFGLIWAYGVASLIMSAALVALVILIPILALNRTLPPQVTAFIKIIIGTVISAFVLLEAVAGIFVSGFSGSELMMAIYAVGGLVLLPVAPLVLFRYIRIRTALIITGSILAVFVLSITGITLYNNYQSSIPVLADYVSIQAYQPYREDGDRLAVLNEPANMMIRDNFPRMDGATALYPVYAAFAKAVYPEIILRDDLQDPFNQDSLVRCTKTPDAYASLIEGERDIIFVAAPSASQIEKAAEAGKELLFTPIGREGFVFFVNSKNPVNGLTSAQIRQIYNGAVTNWRIVGGKNKEIAAYQRNVDSGSQSAFIRFMGDVTPMQPVTNEYTGMGRIIEVAAYKNHTNAIGFSFHFFTQELVKNEGIKLLAVDGIEPTAENITSGVYPLAGNFYAVTVKGNTNPHVQALLDWILSEQGQEIIFKTGYSRL